MAKWLSSCALLWQPRVSPVQILGADPALLDGYQVEREPHVRTIIASAIATGRVVCTVDPAMASARDEQMLAARAAGHRRIHRHHDPVELRPGDYISYPGDADHVFDALEPGTFAVLVSEAF